MHTAVVICSPAPDAKMLVQIVVASNGEGGGTERQRLQARMEQTAQAGRPGGTGNTGGGGNVGNPGNTGGGNTGGAARGGTALNWSDYPLVAQRGYDKSGQRSTYSCPPNGTAAPVWGTDFYTDDSSICTAAVHAGLISFASGGTVTVEVRRPGLPRYSGTSRNGVNTKDYNNGPNPTLGAFVFAGGGGNTGSVGNTAGGGNAGNPGNTGATGNSGGGRNTGGGTGGDVFGPREDNTAFNGTTLTYYPRPSVEQCQSDCVNNGNCKGYTWIKAGTYNPGDSAMCYLLSAVTGRAYVAGHISAIRGSGNTGRGGTTGTAGNTGGGGNTGDGGARGTAIKWSDYPLAAQRGYDKSGQRTTYTCPPNGTPAPVWGTDFYTDDSSVCTAAVHAGLISFASGGTVTVEVRRPGLPRYIGSSRNGVNTKDYDNGPNPTLGAFVFVR